MKPSRLTLALALALTSLCAWAQPKYGHANTGLVLEALPATAAADSMLQLYQDSLRVGYQALEDEFKTKLQTAQEGAADMTPKQVQAAQLELQEMQQQIQVFQQESARMFEARREQYLTPILDRVVATVRSYAQANGYAIVFDSSLPQALLFAQDAADLTPVLIAELSQ